MFIVIIKEKSIKEVGFLYQFWRYWFLQTMFIVVILFYFLSKIINIDNRKTQIKLMGGTLALGIMFSYIIKFPDEMPLYLNVAPMAMFFYMAGYALKRVFLEK